MLCGICEAYEAIIGTLSLCNYMYGFKVEKRTLWIENEVTSLVIPAITSAYDMDTFFGTFSAKINQ